MFGKKKNKAMSKEWSKEILCGLLSEEAQASVRVVSKQDRKDIERLRSMFLQMGSH